MCTARGGGGGGGILVADGMLVADRTKSEERYFLVDQLGPVLVTFVDYSDTLRFGIKHGNRSQLH